MTTSEKVAYLKGLAEGLGIDPNEREGKLLNAVADILEDLAFDVEDVEARMGKFEEGLDALGAGLSDMEETLFGDFDDDAGDPDPDGENGEEVDHTAFYEAKCPNCGRIVTFDENVLSRGGIECPSCGSALEFEFNDDGPAAGD